MRSEFLDRIASDTTSGRIGEPHARFFFEREKFVIKFVVLLVGDYRFVKHVIVVRVLI